MRLALAAVLITVGLLAAGAAGAEPLRDFCAERPGAATPPCILDAGHLMLEMDVLDLTHDREGAVSQQTVAAFSPHLRLGLTETLEAGLQLAPYVRQRLRDRSVGPASSTSGFGDATAALKLSLRNPDGGGVSVAVLPFLSIPLAQRGLGAGGFQGGVILPVSIALPHGFSLGLAPEADLLRDSGGGGTHGAYTGVVALGHALGAGLTGSLELVATLDDAPEGRTRQASAGASLAWIPAGRPDLQLDLGTDLGLSRSAPDARAYVGVSRRF